MRATAGAFCGGLAALLVAVGCEPAAAGRVGDGSLVFAGSVAIPTFPCAPPGPSQPGCVGTFTASTAGVVHGVDGSNPWQVAINAATNGSFTYFDTNDPGVACAVGTAGGTASLNTALGGQAFGAYQAGDTAYTVSGVAVTYGFGWTRVGATAVLTITDIVVTLDVDGLGPRTVGTSGLAGAVASFVPAPDTGPPTGCAGGAPTSIRGSIFGNVSGATTT